MALRLSYCTFRSLFKHAFGTSHGSRDGTDVLFISAEEDGATGYGEITLPPYLKETVPGSIIRLEATARRGFRRAGQLLVQLDALSETDGAPAFRAGLSMALIDLISKHRQWSVKQMLEVSGSERPVALMTVGICEPAEVLQRSSELPVTAALKVKVGDPGSGERLSRLVAADGRKFLLDGNQGFGSLAEARRLFDLAGRDRMLGFEQPFTAEHDPWNAELAEATGATVFADESIQHGADLAAKHALFGGVNIKLMKCGGLDRAKAMADKARLLGMRVMLGSMSETSLGCTAMAWLAPEADIVDLDGPWLIKNDPFQGISLRAGELVVPDGPGLGAELVADLRFTPIGA